MAAKLSKKELKSPDAFQTTFERVGDYVADHKTRVMVIAVALASAAVVVLGIYFYWSYYTSSALKIYSKAQNNIIKSGDNEQTVTDNLSLYNQLIEKYPYSWSGRMAYYHLGNIYYNKGDIDKAIKSYENFIKKSASDKTGMKFLALTSMGYAYENKKDFKEALKYFEQAQSSFNIGFEAIGYRNIARIYEEMNDKEKALENYKKALGKTTENSAILFLKRKISSLS